MWIASFALDKPSPESITTVSKIREPDVQSSLLCCRYSALNSRSWSAPSIQKTCDRHTCGVFEIMDDVPGATRHLTNSNLKRIFIGTYFKMLITRNILVILQRSSGRKEIGRQPLSHIKLDNKLPMYTTKSFDEGTWMYVPTETCYTLSCCWTSAESRKCWGRDVIDPLTSDLAMEEWYGWNLRVEK